MKTVVIGAGYFGINYVRELSGNLVGVIETDEERAKFVQQHYNVPVFPSIPDDLQYDAAVIVTPPESHVKIALEEVKKNKLVLLEKPMAVSVEELLLLRKYRKQVMSGLIYLYNPSIIQLKDTLKTTPIYHTYARRTNDGPVREWQDAMWDLAVHDIAIYNFLFDDKPFASQGMRDRNWCMLRLTYPAVEALIYASWHGGPKIRRLELIPVNSSERIVFDDVSTIHSISPLRLMLDDFLTGQWNIKASYDAGLDVIYVLEALEHAI